MRVTRSVAIWVFIAAAGAYFALYVWPTPYREYRSPDGTSIIWVNRVTGAQHGTRLWGP
jgi:hypothetical protein